MSPLTTLTRQVAAGDAATTAAHAQSWEGRNELVPNFSKLLQKDAIPNGYSVHRGFVHRGFVHRGFGRESVTDPDSPRYAFCVP
jgi:hypothetical protein